MGRARVSLPTLTPAPASAGVVDVITGMQPVVPPVPSGPLSEAGARALTDRIRATAREIGDRLARLRMLVDQARDGEAWVVLGYASWTAYLAATLEPMRLPRTERREVVGYLTGEGMSTRAIGSIVSVDAKTVTNDRRALAAAGGVESSTPAQTSITGRDGRQYVATPRPRLVVLPEPTDARAEIEREARRQAALALELARADRVHLLLHPDARAWHASSTFERARDHAARWCACDLAQGNDPMARTEAAAYVLLEERARAAFAQTADRERAAAAVASTRAG